MSDNTPGTNNESESKLVSDLDELWSLIRQRMTLSEIIILAKSKFSSEEYSDLATRYPFLNNFNSILHQQIRQLRREPESEDTLPPSA